MKNANFFIWYCSYGIKSFLGIWKNFISFFWRYFSVAELFFTLFSHWKKDITFRYWRGFQFSKFLQAFLENTFSRFVGMIVRLVVILIGLAAELLAIALGIVILFIWITAPVLIFSFLFKLVFVRYDIFSLLALASVIILELFIYLSYKGSKRQPYSEMALKELYKQNLFRRVCGRMGKDINEVGEKVFSGNQSLEKFLEKLELTPDDFEKILKREIRLQRRKENKSKFWLKENLDKKNPIGNYWKYAYTVNLDRFSVDLSRSDPTEYEDIELSCRREDSEMVKLILERPAQNSVLLTGSPGVGKKSIIHSLAGLIRREKVKSEQLEEKRILLFDLGRAVSDASDRGKSVEDFLHQVFYEAAYAENVILVIENIAAYLKWKTSASYPDIVPILSEYLSLPTFQVIATSTPKEYHQLIEQKENLMKYMEVVEVKEPSEEETMAILFEKFREIENKRVVFTYRAFQEITKNSSRYLGSSPLPERAIDLAMEVLVFWRKESSPFISSEAVSKFLSLKTGIPLGKIGEEEKEKLLNLENIIHNRIMGQKEAVRQVSEALRRIRSGIGDSKKPIGSFLFLGPTGVGKTETAKALAEAYFKSEERIVRLDMSEFQLPNSVDRIIGSQQLNKPGQLTSKIKDNPFSLLLLDEIEKAYPDVLNLFLQILDEGFITDAFGKKINFRNTIIIATSNAGAVLIKEMVAQNQSPEKIKKELIDYVIKSNIFRLEFLNRFDSVIFFRPLNKEEIKAVTILLLRSSLAA